MDPHPLLTAMIMAHIRDDCEEDELVEQLSCTEGPEEVFYHVKFLKEKGNDMFRRGDLEQALHTYETAAKLLSCTFPSCDESGYRDLAFSINLNIAACAIKLKQFERARTLCSLVLEFDSRNVKAHFRRAIANMELGLLEESIGDLGKVLEIEPKNKDASRELDKVKSLLFPNTKRKRCQDELEPNHDVKGKKVMAYGVNQEAYSLEARDSLSSTSFTAPQSCVLDNENARHGACLGVSNVEDIACCPSTQSDEMSCISHEGDPANLEVDYDNASSGADMAPSKPKFQFFSKRNRSSGLNISSKTYALLSQGKEVMFFHPHSLSTLKVRVLQKPEQLKPDLQPTHEGLSMDLEPGSSTLIEPTYEGNSPTVRGDDVSDSASSSLLPLVHPHQDSHEECLTLSPSSCLPSEQSSSTLFVFSAQPHLQSRWKTRKRSLTPVLCSYLSRVKQFKKSSKGMRKGNGFYQANKPSFCRSIGGKKRKLAVVLDKCLCAKRRNCTSSSV